MKYCTNCGNKLEENANICLKCGRVFNNNSDKKKKKGFPTWAIIVIVVGCVIIIPIIILVLVTLFTYRYIEKNDIDVEKYIDNYIFSEGTIGDTLETGDLSFTLNDSVIYDTIDEFNGKIEGKEYLVFFFDIKNNGDETKRISSYDFVGYLDDYSVSVKKLFSTIDGKNELELKLAPGKTVSGYVAFVVDENWSSFEVHYNNYDDDELIFNVVNSDNNGLDA